MKNSIEFMVAPLSLSSTADQKNTVGHHIKAIVDDFLRQMPPPPRCMALAMHEDSIEMQL
jgi:hypothetical protein